PRPRRKLEDRSLAVGGAPLPERRILDLRGMRCIVVSSFVKESHWRSFILRRAGGPSPPRQRAFQSTIDARETENSPWATGHHRARHWRNPRASLPREIA